MSYEGNESGGWERENVDWYGMRGDKGRISIEFYDKRLGFMLFWKWVRWRDGWQGETLLSC